MNAKIALAPLLTALACSPGDVDAFRGRATIGRASVADLATSSAPDDNVNVIPAYFEQELSAHPVGTEWMFRVPPLAELRELSDRAYAEWQRRIAACMRERGFVYEVPTSIEVPFSEFARVMNPVNSIAAETWGYHLPERPVVVDPNAEVGDESFMLALNGAEDDPGLGCGSIGWSESMALIEEASTEAETLVNVFLTVLPEYDATAQHDEDELAWARCMGSHGYDYSRRGEPVDQYRPLPSITLEELEVRSADLGCDREVGATEHRSQWEAQQFAAWNADTSAQWGEVQRLMDTASDELAAREDDDL